MAKPDVEGLVSMKHAFTTAGIPAIVASLWDVPDKATKEIMISFYENLQRGQDKEVALQQAKSTYLKNSKDKNLEYLF